MKIYAAQILTTALWLCLCHVANAADVTGYIYHEGDCVKYSNIAKREGQTEQECADWCTEYGPDCFGFHFSHNYGGRKYKAGDCQLQKSARMVGCNGRYSNLDFYRKAPPKPKGYIYHNTGCFHVSNIARRKSQTAQECADWCTEYGPDCAGFYRTVNGHRTSCLLQSSAAMSGCDGQDHNYNLDFYKKAPTESGSNGDPHFKTWAGEHFEYHGQCDLVLAKVPDFADGLGLDIHIRTKIVRFWSYNKNAVIRIGTDILEVTGSGDVDDWEAHYWMNYEPQGELSTIGGFPVKTEAPASAYKRTYEIDLDSKYPGQKIVLQIYKEFVRVDIKNASKESFGNAIGILGDFNTGKTLARDGATEMNDFVEYGSEWQVLPSEPKLFHELESPQFPKKCVEPEDPRGERRRRRLDESNVTNEQAEAACSSLKDPLDRKDCVYDIIATQDLDMVGAY